MNRTIRVSSVMWFALGIVAAVLATTVVMQAWQAVAAPADEDTTYVPITPCRLADTRPDPNRVGPNASFGEADTKEFEVSGDESGECDGIIPDEARGLVLNVTALNATALSFVTVWPDGDLPLAASLNPAPSQPPVPNAVTTRLSDDGTFKVYNDVGTVDLVIDVNGYFIRRGFGAFVVSESFPINLSSAGDNEGHSVDCPGDALLTGGGVSITDNQGLDIRRSIPSDNLASWSGAVTAESFPYDGTLNIWVVCSNEVALVPDPTP